MGFNLVKNLFKMGYIVVVVDIDFLVCQYVWEKIGVMVFEGSVVNILVLLEVGVCKVGVVIVVFQEDVLNLVLVILLKYYGVL